MYIMEDGNKVEIKVTDKVKVNKQITFDTEDELNDFIKAKRHDVAFNSKLYSVDCKTPKGKDERPLYILYGRSYKFRDSIGYWFSTDIAYEWTEEGVFWDCNGEYKLCTEDELIGWIYVDELNSMFGI